MSTMPPPAPNRPFTIPAAAPDTAKPNHEDRFKEITLWIFTPKGLFYAKVRTGSQDPVLKYSLVTENSEVTVDAGKIKLGNSDGFFLLLAPLFHVLNDQIVFDHEITVVHVRCANVVHDVVAVLGFDQLNIAGLTLCIEAPVVECFHHLAGIDILVKAAGALGAGILGLAGCQLAEGFGGHSVQLVPLLQNGLSLGLCGLLLLVGVDGLTGLVVLLATGELNENVTDILQLHHVVFTAMELQDVEADDFLGLLAVFILGGVGALDEGQGVFGGPLVDHPLLDVFVGDVLIENVIINGSGNVLLVLVDLQSLDGGVQPNAGAPGSK